MTVKQAIKILKHANTGSEQEIYEKISDICISMKAEDYLELPDRIVRDIPVHLSAEAQRKYDEFEKEQVLQLQATKALIDKYIK